MVRKFRECHLKGFKSEEWIKESRQNTIRIYSQYGHEVYFTRGPSQSEQTFCADKIDWQRAFRILWLHIFPGKNNNTPIKSWQSCSSLRSCIASYQWCRSHKYAHGLNQSSNSSMAQLYQALWLHYLARVCLVAEVFRKNTNCLQSEEPLCHQSLVASYFRMFTHMCRFCLVTEVFLKNTISSQSEEPLCHQTLVASYFRLFTHMCRLQTRWTIIINSDRVRDQINIEEQEIKSIWMIEKSALTEQYLVQITASLKDQDTTLSSKAPAKESPAGAGVTGDPRANWLPADTAHGGPHNWSKKEPTPAPGNIQDPRHPWAELMIWVHDQSLQSESSMSLYYVFNVSIAYDMGLAWVYW